MTSPGTTSSGSAPSETRAWRSAKAALLKAVFDGRDSETVGRSTRAGLFVPASLSDLHLLFEAMELESYASIADLGSGDGRVVLLASLYTKAVGLEIDPALTAAARAEAMSLGFDRAEFRVVDFAQAGLGEFELLYIYPDKPIDELARRLAAEYSGRLLVYGPHFAAPGLEEIARYSLPVHQARLYRVG